MPLITNSNSFASSEKPRLEGETSAPELEEVEGEGEISTAPSALKLEAAAAPQSEEGQVEKKFEWNVEKLFIHNPEHSLARTWFVRILGLIIGIPTLILDLGRRIAFSLGLVNGKSYSLIDKASDACKAVSEKVKAFVAPKELSLEEQNERALRRIEEQVQNLIDGYRRLNGGYFHTNSSFSSPYALNAEAQIREAKIELVNEVNDFAARNAQQPEEFSGHVETAKELIQGAINRQAGEEFYIKNKIERCGEPDLLRDVAFDEFLKAFEVSSKNLLAHSFVDVANRGTNFIAGLCRGIESRVLTREQANEALQNQAVSLYNQGLETGIEEAERSVNELFDSAVCEKLVTRAQANELNEQIHPDVEVLATAAARDVARINPPIVEVPNRLINISNSLQRNKRLSPENVSQFLTSAEDRIAQAKVELEAEAIRQREEAEKIEIERVAAVQKAADQQSQFYRFAGMLGLIERKQKELTTQFLHFDQLEAELKETAEQLETLRNAGVMIRGQETTVLQAAGEYFAALSHIARSNLTAIQREEQMKALADEGFTKGTIDKIGELKALEPKLTQIVNTQATLAREIEKNHDQLARLRGVYAVFRKHNFGSLETENRKAVVAREASISKTQKTLNERHAQIIGRTGIMARMRRDQPSIPVNIDAEENRNEVEALIGAFRQETQEVEALPSVPPFYRRLAHYATAPYRWIRG